MSRSLLSHLDMFRTLSPADLAAVEARLQMRTVRRGEALVEEGDEAAELFVVVSGRFRVWRSGQPAHIAEIGPGQPIGEIAFLRGGPRTATVRAARDSVVVALTREDFDDVAQRSPGIWPTLTATLAARLAETSLASSGPSAVARPKTIAVCPAGSRPVSETFHQNLARTFAGATRAMFLSSAWLRELSPALADLKSSDAELTTFLNKLEEAHDYVVYVADPDLTLWTEKALRQADLILWIGDASSGTGSELNAIERFAAQAQSLGEEWLVLVRPSPGTATGTLKWLTSRPRVALHHHVGRDNVPDYQRLLRFVDGKALGLVACGGGAFSAAHIGTYQALQEAGLQFDIMGGTSGGAAIAAAFALGVPADDISRLIEDIFIAKRAMGRWTWPRYSLLDHAVLDAELARHYTDVNIEDLWTPFFAVSTNVTRAAPHYHRTGKLWKAIRASGSIPALLPPVYTDDGEILVDGCLLDNVPVKAMRDLKSGPNVVLELEIPTLLRHDLKYEDIPARRDLLWKLVTPFRRAELPLAPSPQAVLVRSLMVNRQEVAEQMTAEDLLLMLPVPERYKHLNWREHRRLREMGYAFARTQLDAWRAQGHPLFAGD
jgi:NTE family protein